MGSGGPRLGCPDPPTVAAVPLSDPGRIHELEPIARGGLDTRGVGHGGIRRRADSPGSLDSTARPGPACPFRTDRHRPRCRGRDQPHSRPDDPCETARPDNQSTRNSPDPARSEGDTRACPGPDPLHRNRRTQENGLQDALRSLQAARAIEARRPTLNHGRRSSRRRRSPRTCRPINPSGRRLASRIG